MSTILKIKDLSRYYGYRRALKEFSFSLNEGECICIQGPNGAGKTTLLSALISRNPPDQGHFFYNGNKINSLEERKSYLADTAYLGHETGLFYDLSALENLMFFSSLYESDYTTPEHLEKIEMLLRKCNLAGRKHDPVRSYSRGMKQRLALARTFLYEPKIVILDEPLTGLDYEGVRVLLRLLRENKDAGNSCILVTHSDGFFKEITDRFLFLKNGELVADIPVAKYNEASRKQVFKILYPEESE